MKKFLLIVQSWMVKLLGVLVLWLIQTPAVSALPITYQIPVNLATQSATEAVNLCQSKGYPVTATVVTKEGLKQVLIRGDGAPPHTIENSFNKAYTAISLGPIQHVNSTKDIVKAMIPSANPVGNWPLLASPLPGITFGSGGVAIKVGNEIIGGLGVSGAPNGMIDEECAQAGLTKISPGLTP